MEQGFALTEEIIRFMESSEAAIVIYEVREGKVTPILVSEGAARLFGFEGDRVGAADFLYHDTYETVHPEDAARASHKSLEFILGQEPVYQTSYRMQLFGEKKYRPLLVKCYRKHMGERTLYLTYYEDITCAEISFPPREPQPRRRQDQAAAWKSEDEMYDSLTGLPKIGFLIERGDKVVRRIVRNHGAPVVMYLNIERMKNYNAIYGFEEGSILLRQVGSMLTEAFPKSIVARFSDDHFLVITDEEKVKENASYLHEQVKKVALGGDADCHIGVCRIGKDTDDISTACDYAKLAADLTKHLEKGFGFYDSSMSRRSEIQNYVVKNLDEALHRGYIKAYYQPVIRTITGALCGMEALCRWDDPLYGILSPAVVIQELENTHQIHKLDCYMIREICRNLHQKMEAGEPVVPISFNLSRLDFLSCDIFTVVEEAVRHNRIPRDMVHIEITESVMMNERRIWNEIVRFQNAGYQVWMDDFGSGYSALSILKDFHFDEVKIDMMFLSSFSKVSQDIIESVIDMNKTIGTQSLAEGVETEEQFLFLKGLGCNKVQGYYFGRPLPYEESMENCLQQGMTVETRAWREYYDQVGKINMISDAPVAIIEDDGSHFRMLQMNKTFRRTLERIGIPKPEKVGFDTDSPLSGVGRSLRNFIDLPARTKQEESMFFVYQDQYLRLNLALVAENGNQKMYRGALYNISGGENRRGEELDASLRNIYNRYDEMYKISCVDDEMISVLAPPEYFLGQSYQGVKEAMEKYCLQYIYHGDQKRYREFSEITTLHQRVGKTEKGYITDYFRTLSEDGQYHWKLHTFLAVADSKNTQVLYTVKSLAVEQSEVSDLMLQSLQEMRKVEQDGQKEQEQEYRDGSLWRNFMRKTTGNYYWKDRRQRYCGVSAGMLHLLGLESQEDIVGRLESEFQWNLDVEETDREEREIMQQGKDYLMRPIKGMIRGEIHDLLLDRVPVYHAGKVIGIIGYFIDMNDIAEADKEKRERAVTDSVTGAKNIRGLLIHAIDYMQAAEEQKMTFGAVLVHLPEYDRIQDAYGEEVAQELLAMAAVALEDCVETQGLVCRVTKADFVLLQHYAKSKEIYDMAEKVKGAIAQIHKVKGKSCTVSAHCDVLEYTDVGEEDAFLYQLSVHSKKLVRERKKK